MMEGDIKRKGSLMYVPQEAWVFSGTLRDNILFGEAMDFPRYEHVLKTCALVRVSIITFCIARIIEGYS